MNVQIASVGALRWGERLGGGGEEGSGSGLVRLMLVPGQVGQTKVWTERGSE